MSKKGTVKKVIGGQFGYIQPDDGSEDVYFRLNWVKNVPATGIATDLRVEYEDRRTPRGLQTKWVRALSQPSSQPKSLRGYRFQNPYNFVRPLPSSNSGSPLLGKTEPPPHDRYVGYSGAILCELTAVTPLFTASSEGVEPVNSDHNAYQFFQINDKVAIPASSLRGSIRSVFEAATNSCYSTFHGHRRLSHHVDSRQSPQLVPARVEKDGNDWRLRLLTGSTPLQVGRTPNGYQYAAWLHNYWPMRPSGTLRQSSPANSRTRSFQNRRKKGTENNLTGFKHGDECFALLDAVQHPFPRIKFWDVIAISKDKTELEQRKSHNQKIERGWLSINNQNIETKHSERFFFRSQSNKTGPSTIPLPVTVRDEYEDLIADYQERHADDIKKRKDKGKSISKPINKKDAGFSRFIYSIQERKINGGELVYAYLENSEKGVVVKFIAPVSVPRVAYQNKLEDLIEYSYLQKCDDLTELCPGCRTFGWVWGSGDPRKEIPSDKPIGYAGRVQFSHAKLTHDAGTFDTTLAILSSPKPTTIRFYLRSKDGKNMGGRDDEWVNYDARGQTLRGRKFYYHHGEKLSETEYKRASEPDETKPIQDDQNRSAKGVQKQGSCFQFMIYFENLAALELGALLWSVEMEGWYHRIGMAKPLGFGSVQIQIHQLDLLNPNIYQSLSPNSDWTPTLKDKDVFINKFKEAMFERYGDQFSQLANIRDLQAMLANSPELPIHYPRTTRNPLSEGKNFEWFVGNSRSGRNAGPRITLKIADESQQGLPLLDKQGRERRG